MSHSRLLLCAVVGLSATTMGCVDLTRSAPILVLKDSDIKVVVQPTAAGVQAPGQAAPAVPSPPSRPRGTG